MVIKKVQISTENLDKPLVICDFEDEKSEGKLDHFNLTEKQMKQAADKIAKSLINVKDAE
jgi:hypothetical protein